MSELVPWCTLLQTWYVDRVLSEARLTSTRVRWVQLLESLHPFTSFSSFLFAFTITLMNSFSSLSWSQISITSFFSPLHARSNTCWIFSNTLTKVCIFFLLSCRIIYHKFIVVMSRWLCFCFDLDLVLMWFVKILLSSWIVSLVSDKLADYAWRLSWNFLNASEKGRVLFFLIHTPWIEPWGITLS